MALLPTHGVDDESETRVLAMPRAVTATITIDPVIRGWIAPLRPDEVALLEQSIQTEGCRDALIAWDRGDVPVLLDGHHRHAICERLGIRYRIETRAFETRDAVEVWVRSNQAGRRNLTDDQRAINADLLAEANGRIEKRHRSRKANDKRHAKFSLEATAASKESGTRVRANAARVNRVSEKRVRRARAIRIARPDLAKQVSAGTITIKDAERIMRREWADTKRRAVVATAKQIVDRDYDIHHEPCAVVVDRVAAGSVALVFTDPPYGDSTLQVFAELGRIAAQVLRPGGSLITYIAQHRLPEILAMLQQGTDLRFHWPIAIMMPSGDHARMAHFSVVVGWKLLLWFTNGPARRRRIGWVSDVVESPGKSKAAHAWEQNIEPARYYINTLTDPGDLVFDPFCGGGTTVVAAAQLQRRWLTCDVDEAAVWTARARVREALGQ